MAIEEQMEKEKKYVERELSSLLELTLGLEEELNEAIYSSN